MYPIFGSKPYGRLSTHSRFGILIQGMNFIFILCVSVVSLEVNKWIDFLKIYFVVGCVIELTRTSDTTGSVIQEAQLRSQV